MTGRIKKAFVAIATLLIAMAISVEIGYANITIIVTAGKLFNCNLYIQDYNSSSVKTDADTERILEIQEERDSLYNSENWLIKTYSNLPSVIKFVVVIIAFIILMMTLILWVVAILKIVAKMEKTLKRQRRRKANHGNRVA